MQIDLLFERADKVITIVEIKFSRSPYIVTKKLIEELEEKRSLFNSHFEKNMHVTLALISGNVIKNNQYSDNLKSVYLMDSI